MNGVINFKNRRKISTQLTQPLSVVVHGRGHVPVYSIPIPMELIWVLHIYDRQCDDASGKSSADIGSN